MSFILIILGCVALFVGAESLVRGASKLAASIGLSPIVIGLTVVALGTSAPEMFVGIIAALQDKPDLLLGNVVGSNIANTMLILGFAALIRPLRIHAQLVRTDVPIMIGVSAIVFAMSLNQTIGRVESIALTILGILYMFFIVKSGKVQIDASEIVEENKQSSVVVNLGFIILGVALLIAGSDWLINGSTQIAKAIGISDLVIGLTVVAIGTSMPEIITSLVAAFRDESDIAVGNVVGSNISNLLLVLGLSGSVTSNPIPISDDSFYLNLPIMCATALFCFPLFLAGYRITRKEGGLMLLYYVSYLLMLYFMAVYAPNLTITKIVSGLFVIPLLFVSLWFAGVILKQPAQHSET